MVQVMDDGGWGWRSTGFEDAKDNVDVVDDDDDLVPLRGMTEGRKEGPEASIELEPDAWLRDEGGGTGEGEWERCEKDNTFGHRSGCIATAKVLVLVMNIDQQKPVARYFNTAERTPSI